MGLGRWRCSGGTVPNRRAVMAVFVLRVVWMLRLLVLARLTVMMVLVLVRRRTAAIVLRSLGVSAITETWALVVLSSIRILCGLGVCSMVGLRVL